MVDIELAHPLWVGTFVLVGLVLLKYSGFADRIRRGLGFVVAAVMFWWLTAATSIGFWNRPELVQAQSALGVIWQVIAWILLLVGAFLVASDLAKAKQ